MVASQMKPQGLTTQRSVAPPPPWSGRNVGCSITEAASTLGVTMRTLRHYEQEGLIRPPRAIGGDRRYPGAVLAKLRMIVVLRQAAVPIREIAAAYALAEADQGRRFAELITARLDSLAGERDRLEAALAGMSTTIPKPSEPTPFLAGGVGARRLALAQPMAQGSQLR